MVQPILIVDDSEDDLFLIRRAFQKAGIKLPLRMASDGEQALELLGGAVADPARADLPCLILLDLKMPRVPGLELLDWIRKHPVLRTVPVVVLTSSSADADVAAAYNLGANSYFAKPGSDEDLLSLVRLLDEYWLKRCMLPPHCR